MADSSDTRLWALPPSDRLAVLRQEIDRLVARVATLDDGGLDRPAMGDWTVRDVVAHLGVVAEFYTDSIVRGSAGDAEPGGGRAPAGTGRGEVAAASIRQGAATLARVHDDVIGRLRKTAAALADVLQDVDERSDPAFPCYHPGGIVPANQFLVLYLKELGLHEWDMFEALEPPCPMGRWGADAAFQAMEIELASGSLRWVTDPARSPETATIRVVTTGAVPGQRDLLLEPDRTRLVPVDPDRPVDATIGLDTADFVLACSGRLDPMAAVAAGAAEGDTAAVQLLARRLTGM